MTAVFIVAVSVLLIGQYLNSKIKKRIISLKHFILLLENINSQISFSKKNIDEIIHDFEYSSDVKMKTMCELNSNLNGNFHENWKCSIEKYAQQDCLSKEDINILLSFGKNLGTTDLQGQINNVKLHIGMLEKELKNAEDNLSGKLKINTALSTASALLLIIILY